MAFKPGDKVKYSNSAIRAWEQTPHGKSTQRKKLTREVGTVIQPTFKVPETNFGIAVVDWPDGTTTITEGSRLEYA